MLSEIAYALASTNDKYYFYLDLQTGAVVKCTETINGMDIPFILHAYPDRLLPLPRKSEIHAYGILEGFLETPIPDKKPGSNYAQHWTERVLSRGSGSVCSELVWKSNGRSTRTQRIYERLRNGAGRTGLLFRIRSAISLMNTQAMKMVQNCTNRPV